MKKNLKKVSSLSERTVESLESRESPAIWGVPMGFAPCFAPTNLFGMCAQHMQTATTPGMVNIQSVVVEAAGWAGMDRAMGFGFNGNLNSNQLSVGDMGNFGSVFVAKRYITDATNPALPPPQPLDSMELESPPEFMAAAISSNACVPQGSYGESLTSCYNN